MKTQQTDQRWDDIIFENRNKAYGAYAIRQRYPVNILRALVLSGGAVIGIFFFPSHTTPKTITDKIIKDIFTGPSTPPVIEPEILQKEIVSSKKVKATLLPTRVTTKDVPEVEPIDIADTGNSSTGNIDGTSIEIVDGNGLGELPVETVTVKTPEFLLTAEIMPSYEGGIAEMTKFIQKKLHYPTYAAKMRIEGTVYIGFVVSANGSIINIEVIKGIDKSCDEEAKRVISLMNRWKPGMQNKMPVSVRMVLPIKFVAGE